MDRLTILSGFKQILENYIEDRTLLDNVREEHDMIEDLRINSAHLIDVVLDTETYFDIEIDTETIERITTVGSCIDIVIGKLDNAVSRQ